MDPNIHSQPTPPPSIPPQQGPRPFTIFLTIILFVLGFFGARYIVLKKIQNNNPLFSNQIAQYLDNVLIVLGAQLDSKVNPTTLTVRFNNPVDPHELTHFASLSPKIIGEWKVDPTDKTIARFNFKKPYKGQTLWFYIGQGLKSTNNKTLSSDYSTRLVIENNTQYEQYSRVKSFSVGKPIPLYSDSESVAIYKSNAQNLLQFLTYTRAEGITRPSIYDGTFKEASIQHQESDKLQTLNVNDDDTISLDPGIYYVENDTTKPYFIVVSSFGALLRQDDKKVILYAFNLQNGVRINDTVTFGLYNLENSVNLLRDFAYTENNTSVPFAFPTKLDTVIGIYKNEVVFIPVEIPNSLADIRVNENLDTTSKIFVYTDRPIYKPGDTVFIKGIVRLDADSQYKIPPVGSTIYLRLPGKDNKEIVTTATLDEFGTFFTHYLIPKDYDSESAYVQASAQPFSEKGYGFGYAAFEIVKYIKPEFEIKTSVEKNEYLRPEKLKFTIDGNYFSGKPLSNKDIEYTLYTDSYYEVEKAVYNKNFNISSPGGMCGGGGFADYYGEEYKSGKVTLNADGKATIEADVDNKAQLSQKITLVAKTVDGNKNNIISASNAIVHAAEFNIFFIPSAENYNPGEEVVAPFYAERLSGEKVSNTVFEYKLIDYVYNDSNTEKKSDTIITSGKVETDENGKGIVRFTLPQELTEETKQLIVYAKDARNNTSQNQKTLSIITAAEKEAASQPSWWGDSVSQTYLKISSNQNSFKVGDTVSLTIDSPGEFDALVTLERGRIYDPKVIHLQKGTNTFSFKVDEQLSPSITVVFSFFIKGKYYTEGLSLNVPAMHKLLNIGLTLNKVSFSPSETAELLITTKNADGAPIATNMSVGVVDKAIYALRENATPPVHSSFYYFRPRNTNASSSLTGMNEWGGGGGGGGGNGNNPGSTVDVLYWNPNVKTDASGEVRVPIPLFGHKTIWKIQVLGSTINSDVGQADMEFLVGSEVKGARTRKRSQ